MIRDACLLKILKSEQMHNYECNNFFFDEKDTLRISKRFSLLVGKMSKWGRNTYVWIRRK